MASGQFEGRAAAIRGAVIDLAFDDQLPLIEDAVQTVDADGRIVAAEIQQTLLQARAAHRLMRFLWSGVGPLLNGDAPSTGEAAP